MDDEQLIEVVRKYSVIYDTSNAKYMDSNYKRQIWKKIGKELQKTDTVCKNRWQNIRDQFRKNLAKKVAKRGQAAGKLKKYKYEEGLQFLIPHFNDRDTLINVPFPVPECLIPEPMVTLKQEINMDEKHCETEMENRLTEVVTLPSATDRNHPFQESSAAPVMQCMIDTTENQKAETLHPVDAFFTGLAAIVKSFTPYYQHVAKGKLFTVVHELEWQQLQQINMAALSHNETSTHSAATPSHILMADETSEFTNLEPDCKFPTSI